MSERTFEAPPLARSAAGTVSPPSAPELARRVMRARRGLVPFAVSLALSLVACGSDPGDATGTAPPGAASTTTTATGAPAPDSSGADAGPPGPPLPVRHPGRLPDAAPEALGFDPQALDAIDRAVAEAIDKHEIPGAVVLVARHAQVAFRRAYGALALEPEREPMRSDALFDLASLTKPLATALVLMTLVDDGRLALGDRIGTRLPELAHSAAGLPTIEELLLHTSGYPVGMDPVDLERGLRHGLEVLAARARAHPEEFAAPGSAFVYSNLGYIVLGALVERLAGETLDSAFATRVARRLGLEDTSFRRFRSVDALDCPSPTLRDLPRIAPTERRGQAMLRGEVHDPLAFALGGVAGNAGLFSTADEVAYLAQVVLDGGALRAWAAPPSGAPRVLAPKSGREMVRARPVPSGQRALGWDIDTKYSGVRGDVFPIGGFGHSGFTGTSVWVDRASDTLVVILANRVHPNGKGDATRVRRRVATLVARAIRPDAAPGASPSSPAPATSQSASPTGLFAPAPGAAPEVLTGIDVLAREGFARLRGRTVALLTHTAATDRAGRTTLELLAHAPGVTLARVFTPEHGLDARGDGPVGDARDAATGVPIVSLYGAHERPTPADLAGIDAVVVDLQDAGARFYTYFATLGYLLEATARAALPVVVLDRPNPGGGLASEGPLPDRGRASFVAPYRVPVRHGLTFGELARFVCAEQQLACALDVVPLEGWRRDMLFADTGLAWHAPSPNLRTPDAALLYPGVALLEMANVSVGRGTERPFAFVGAPWIDGAVLVAALGGPEAVPGVTLRATSFTPGAAPGAPAPPFAGESCGGIALAVTDGHALEPVRLGLMLIAALAATYGARFELARVDVLLRHAPTLAALARTTPAGIDALLATFASDAGDFAQRRAPFLLYPL